MAPKHIQRRIGGMQCRTFSEGKLKRNEVRSNHIAAMMLCKNVIHTHARLRSMFICAGLTEVRTLDIHGFGRGLRMAAECCFGESNEGMAAGSILQAC